MGNRPGKRPGTVGAVQLHQPAGRSLWSGDRSARSGGLPARPADRAPWSGGRYPRSGGHAALVARRQASLLVVVLGGALAADLVMAGALPAGVLGRGWAWP